MLARCLPSLLPPLGEEEAAVIDSALKKGPQVITRRGRETVVVVAAEEWNRKVRRQGTLADLFAASPLHESGLEIERLEDGPRDLAL